MKIFEISYTYLRAHTHTHTYIFIFKDILYKHDFLEHLSCRYFNNVIIYFPECVERDREDFFSQIHLSFSKVDLMIHSTKIANTIRERKGAQSRRQATRSHQTTSDRSDPGTTATTCILFCGDESRRQIFHMVQRGLIRISRGVAVYIDDRVGRSRNLDMQIRSGRCLTGRFLPRAFSLSHGG